MPIQLNTAYTKHQEFDKMLSSVHLVGEDEDDIYSGFNEYNPAFDTEVSQMKTDHRESLLLS